MEKKDKLIQFTKAGNGSVTPRISLPKTWVEKLGANEENREVTTYQFDNGDILISKTFKMEGIMGEKINEEVFNFGVKVKKLFIEKNKENRLNFYIKHILRELNKENSLSMYYILNLCLELNINSENFFINILEGNKELITIMLTGLMS